MTDMTNVWALWWLNLCNISTLCRYVIIQLESI